MANILIINGHQPYESSKGDLNALLVSLTLKTFSPNNSVEIVKISDGWNNEQEIKKILWADLIFYQFPINSMGAPWILKKYWDDVFTAAMNGRFSSGDGRSRNDPTRQYGSGGLLQNKKYLFSVTLNAPKQAFNDPNQTFFAGLSIDDLLQPHHLNLKFFGMQPLPTFAMYDVKKNPRIESDLKAFDTYLQAISSNYL